MRSGGSTTHLDLYATMMGNKTRVLRPARVHSPRNEFRSKPIRYAVVCSLIGTSKPMASSPTNACACLEQFVCNIRDEPALACTSQRNTHMRCPPSLHFNAITTIGNSLPPSTQL